MSGIDMNFRQQDYLQEMGIQRWVLHRPQMVSGTPVAEIELEPSCLLLLVSPELPQGAHAALFEKVLKSFSVPVDAARHLYPEDLHRLKKHHLKWIWFAGCQSTSDIEANLLISPLLSQVDGNPVHRRELWRQICSYQDTGS